MSNQAIKPVEHMSLVKRIFDCLDHSSSPEKILALTEEFNSRTDLQEDKAFLQSMAVLNFLAHLIRNGNRDLITQKMIEETCTYILNKILPYDKLLQYKIEQSINHNR